MLIRIIVFFTKIIFIYIIFLIKNLAYFLFNVILYKYHELYVIINLIINIKIYISYNYIYAYFDIIYCSNRVKIYVRLISN